MAPKAKSNDAAQRFVWQTHPLYQEWIDTWQLLGEVYEGDGGFLDGSHLVPHPRELVYARDANGAIDYSVDPVQKDKFKRRKALARYENFAQQMIDLFVDHQYTKGVSRGFTGLSDADTKKQPYMRWIEDVDGCGTHLDDWMKQTQTMADVFGHVFVVLDREQPDPAIKIVSAADEPPVYLRVYTPMDALDWTAPHRRLSSIKFVEAKERATLREPSTYAADGGSGSRFAPGGTTASTPNVQYRVWTPSTWSVYDSDGTRIETRPHGYGELPVIPFYSRRRPRIPVLGRSLLGDGRLFKDHFNLISELRELLRSNTFSMLHIQLGDNESVTEAVANLGDHAGTDTIMFTKGEANYIAAPDGPAATYVTEIANAEYKMFRLMGLSTDTDGHGAEAEGSRRIKAMDLNRLLAGNAAEAQRFEYQLARLWYRATFGAQIGQKRWEQAGLSIVHPDEFYVEELAQTIENTLASLEVPMGKTFKTLVRVRALPKLLRDIDAETTDTIKKEIEELAEKEAKSEETERKAADALARASAEPQPVGGTETPPATPKSTAAA